MLPVDLLEVGREILPPFGLVLTLHLGVRVSLYNAVTEQEVDKLIAYMTRFLAESASVAAAA